MHQPRGNDQISVRPSRSLDVAEVLSRAIGADTGGRANPNLASVSSGVLERTPCAGKRASRNQQGTPLDS